MTLNHRRTVGRVETGQESSGPPEQTQPTTVRLGREHRRIGSLSQKENQAGQYGNQKDRLILIETIRTPYQCVIPSDSEEEYPE